MCTEPELHPVHNPDEFQLSTSNTQEGACLYIAMNGFGGSHSERCFVNVCVCNPAVVEVHLSEGISQLLSPLLSQSVSQ